MFFLFGLCSAADLPGQQFYLNLRTPYHINRKSYLTRLTPISLARLKTTPATICLSAHCRHRLSNVSFHCSICLRCLFDNAANIDCILYKLVCVSVFLFFIHIHTFFRRIWTKFGVRPPYPPPDARGQGCRGTARRSNAVGASSFQVPSAWAESAEGAIFILTSRPILLI